MIEQYSALIGPHEQGYYLGYFKRADERGYAPLAWHWPAFFLGPLWLLWRRQYLWAAGSFLLSMIFTIIAGTVQQSSGDEAAVTVSVFLTTCWGIYLGLYGNAIYYRWAKRLIAAAQEHEPRDMTSQRDLLVQAGGVNRHLPLLFVVALIVLTAIANSATLPV